MLCYSLWMSRPSKVYSACRFNLSVRALGCKSRLCHDLLKQRIIDTIGFQRPFNLQQSERSDSGMHMFVWDYEGASCLIKTLYF